MTPGKAAPRSFGRIDAFLSSVVSGRLKGASHVLLAPSSLVLGLFLILPVVLILAISFTKRGPYGSLVWSFTTSNYLQALRPAYFPVLARSFLFAGVTTLLCLAIAYPLAYALSFFAGGFRGALILMLMVPFWNSCLVAIYSWMILLGREGLLNGLLLRLGLIQAPVQFLGTSFAVILGLVYFYLPFMVLPLYACLEKIPRSLIDASKDLGAGVATTFLKVTLPLSLPGVFAGCILTFVPCVGDFLTADFLGGTKTYLIGNLIANQFLAAQDWPFGGAMAAILIVILSTGIFAYLRLESGGPEADALKVR
ncbi:MAG: ABC transporter permease [Elusimicrobia bacterium]|nr:ABC transporter permease [Elusimicrobiota bacterium]